MEFLELKSRQDPGDKKLSRTYDRFEKLLMELKKKKLSDKVVETTNEHIKELNTTSKSSKKLRRIIEKKQGEILSLVEQEHKIVQKGYYLSIWISLGIAIGVGMGSAIGAILGNMAMMGIGIPIGVAIGVAIGASLDKKALKEGRQLDINVA